MPRILLEGVNWACVTGPSQATIAVLGQVGWHPISPDKWLTPDNEEFAELVGHRLRTHGSSTL